MFESIAQFFKRLVAAKELAALARYEEAIAIVKDFHETGGELQVAAETAHFISNVGKGLASAKAEAEVVRARLRYLMGRG